MNRRLESIVIALSLICIPIAIIDWRNMYFLSDTAWFFTWATYSRLWGSFIPILYPVPPFFYQFPDLTTGFLSLLWISVAIASCFILYRRKDNTFMRDIGLLLILLSAQLIIPVLLFTLLVQGSSIYHIWILPIPGPSLLAIAMVVRGFYRNKTRFASNLNVA